MEVFVDVWEAQVDELGKVLRLITAGGDPSKSKIDSCSILITITLDFIDEKERGLWMIGTGIPDSVVVCVWWIDVKIRINQKHLVGQLKFVLILYVH